MNKFCLLLFELLLHTLSRGTDTLDTREALSAVAGRGGGVGRDELRAERGRQDDLVGSLTPRRLAPNSAAVPARCEGGVAAASPPRTSALPLPRLKPPTGRPAGRRPAGRLATVSAIRGKQDSPRKPR